MENLAVSHKETCLLQDPAIPLLCFYLSEMKTYVHTKTCMQMFIAAYLSLSKTENNLKTSQLGIG